VWFNYDKCFTEQSCSSNEHFPVLELTETGSTRASGHEPSELHVVKCTVVVVCVQSAAAAAVLDCVSVLTHSSVFEQFLAKQIFPT